MEQVSFAGVAIAIIAVFLAYYMGYANGVALGRDEGFDHGKKEGKREGSIRAYAVGFDRGKRARDEDDDEDGDDEGGGSAQPNLGFAILAVAAGLLGVLWLSSQTPSAPDNTQQMLSSEFDPVTNPDRLVQPTGTAHDGVSPSKQESLALPRINRALPTTTPTPANGAPRQYLTPAEIQRGASQFSHAPPTFQQPQQ